MFICPMHSVESSARGCDEVRVRRSNAADLCVIDLQHAVVGEEPVHLRLNVAHLHECGYCTPSVWYVAQAMLF